MAFVLRCLVEEDENGEAEESRKIEKKRGNFKSLFGSTVDFGRGMPRAFCVIGL